MRVNTLVYVLLLFTALPSCSTFTGDTTSQDAQPSPDANQSLALKKKIMVLPFLNRTAYGGDELGQKVAGLIVDAMGQCEDCIYVSPDDIEGHEAFSTAGSFYNYKTIFAKARANGLSGVVLGTIDTLSMSETGDEIGIFRSRQFKATTLVRLSIFDTSSEREVVSKTLKGDLSEERIRLPGDRSPAEEETERGTAVVARALDDVLKHFDDYARRIAWEGRIAKVDLRHYYIDAGEETGIALGQLLKVFS